MILLFIYFEFTVVDGCDCMGLLEVDLRFHLLTFLTIVMVIGIYEFFFLIYLFIYIYIYVFTNFLCSFFIC